MKTPSGPADTNKGKECVHDKAGVCDVHGEGAERMFKPAVSTRRGRDGRIIRVVRKEFYWKCKLGPRGGVLRQTTLSFVKVVPECDQPRRQEKITQPFQTITEGQGASSDV